MHDGPRVARDPGWVRLRDAALELFGEVGFEATTMRAVAERAGVTAGLVVHHFGTKLGLRQEVERHVLATISQAFADVVLERDATADELAARLNGFLTMFERQPAIAAYLRRSLLEDSAASMAFFDRLVELSVTVLDAKRARGELRATTDPRAQTLLSMAPSLLPLLIPRQVERYLGVSLQTPEGVERWATAEYELMTAPMFVEPPEVAAERQPKT